VYNYTIQQNMSQKINQIQVQPQKCNRCGKSNLITDSEIGELICGTCGIIIEDKIEHDGAESRNFIDSRTDNSRTGDGTSLRRHDRGLSTIINPLNKDSTGKQISSFMKNTIGRLRIWDSRTQIHKTSDKNLRSAFNELSRLQDKLFLSDAIIEKTAYIYRKAIGKNLSRGRSMSALIAASLYAACRDAEAPRTLVDMAEASNVRTRDIARCYRTLVKELDLKIPSINAVQCVIRIGNNLGITEKTKRHAIKLINQYQQSGDMAGKSPIGIAASVIYLANIKMNESFSQKAVADAANISEVTIRNRSDRIKKILEYQVTKLE
jgi:transcription initiation factor TFIIB